jgi:hypothetical protein
MKKILEEWKPSDPKDARRRVPATEKGWEQSLVNHLRESLPGLQVIPQAGAGMVRGDIVIERKTLLGGINRDIVELKLGMVSTGTFQRLIGQIQVYAKEKGWTFVVICGDEMDPKLMKGLQDHYKGKGLRLAIFRKKSERKGVETLVEWE